MPTPAAPARDVEFWRLRALNRGLPVRVFPDRESACDWLCQRSYFVQPLNPA